MRIVLLFLILHSSAAKVVHDGKTKNGENINRRQRRSAVRDKNNIWHSRDIAYTFGEGFQSDKQPNRTKIEDAMRTISSRTCIRFHERKNDDTHGIHFVRHFSGSKGGSNDGCATEVGFSQEYSVYHEISLADDGYCDGVFLIVHELLHALGFYHEQSRFDRDDHLEILWENIEPDQEEQFSKNEVESTTSFYTDYDFKGVMQYGTTTFSKNGKPTMKVINDPNGTVANSMGQQEDWSDTDVLQVNLLYQCDYNGNGDTYTAWAEWSPCSNMLQKTRQRYCFKPTVSECRNERRVETQTKKCSCEDRKIDGKWSQWSAWFCSNDCTDGKVERTRQCNDPEPVNGGKDCPIDRHNVGASQVAVKKMGFKLIMKNGRCLGKYHSRLSKGQLYGVASCARACAGVSQMFTFGDLGSSNCNKFKFCDCSCQLEETSHYRCKDLSEIKGLSLYAFDPVNSYARVTGLENEKTPFILTELVQKFNKYPVWGIDNDTYLYMHTDETWNIGIGLGDINNVKLYTNRSSESPFLPDLEWIYVDSNKDEWFVDDQIKVERIVMSTVDGHWGQWSAWFCVNSCVDGKLHRTRQCDDPEPSHGGEECATDKEDGGDTQELVKDMDFILLSSRKTCRGEVEQKGFVGSVADCAKLCRGIPKMFIYGRLGSGSCNESHCECVCELSTSNYQCKHEVGSESYDLYAFNHVNGNWGAWSAWFCENGCADRKLIRRRKCDNPKPAYGGKNCDKRDGGAFEKKREKMDFTLVERRKMCYGNMKNVGFFPSVVDCGNECRESSEMFVFGTNRFGNRRCEKDGCKCLCQLDTTNYRCKKTDDDNGFNLFVFDDSYAIVTAELYGTGYRHFHRKAVQISFGRYARHTQINGFPSWLLSISPRYNHFDKTRFLKRHAKTGRWVISQSCVDNLSLRYIMSRTASDSPFSIGLKWMYSDGNRWIDDDSIKVTRYY